MYKQLEDVSAEELKTLNALKLEVALKKAEGYNRRVGANGVKALSKYNFSRWFEWSHAQRALFKDTFPVDYQNKIVQGWFLEIPRGTGFLDLMNYWVGKPLSGTVICTALKDQTILLNHTPVMVKTGQQITFHLSTLHELKPSKEGQLWACAMVMGDPKKITD